MSFSRRSRSLHAWLAVVAFVLTALAPTLAHAFRPGASDWVLLCTAAGSKLVKITSDATATSDADAPQTAPAEVAAMQHCPYCASHTVALGLPPAAPAQAVTAPRLDPALPELFLAGPRTLFAWASARPRGPPSAA